MNKLKQLWTKFWVSRGRCPRCFTLLSCFNDFGVDFGYCRNHIDEAYYEDGVKVIFRD